MEQPTYTKEEVIQILKDSFKKWYQKHNYVNSALFQSITTSVEFQINKQMDKKGTHENLS